MQRKYIRSAINVPYGYCQCGCGQQTAVARQNYEPFGWVLGEPLRFVRGHGSRGLRVDLEARFWSKVDLRGPDECWPWIAATNGRGYGVLGRSDGGSRYAHRIAWEMEHGPIPDGLTIDHLCRNRACVNPAHLDVVTNAENNRRGDSLSAENARKTHCKHGHEFTPANTYSPAPGVRYCRTCRAARNQARATYHARPPTSPS